MKVWFSVLGGKITLTDVDGKFIAREKIEPGENAHAVARKALREELLRSPRTDRTIRMSPLGPRDSDHRA